MWKAQTAICIVLLASIRGRSERFEFFYMVSPTTFLKETTDELKKVTWPKQDEIIRLTFVVVTISIIVGLFIGALDFVFTKATEMVIK